MKNIVLITGASKGIGKELANIFAKNGYSLILIARIESELINLQVELKNKYKCESKILSIDLSSKDSIDKIIATFTEDLSNIEILVNNAGFGCASKFTAMPEKTIMDMLTVNMNVLTMLTFKILPFMIAKKSGKILNVSSTAAFTPGPYMAVYYATKSYVLSFSQALYEEYKQEGIIVSTLCPGITRTNFQARAGMQNLALMRGLLPTMSASQVASIAYKGLRKNKRVIVTGFLNKISVLLMWITPNFLNSKIIAILGKPE